MAVTWAWIVKTWRIKICKKQVKGKKKKVIIQIQGAARKWRLEMKLTKLINLDVFYE